MPVKDAPPSESIFVISTEQVVTNGDLISAINRANRLIEWMSAYVGRMCPGNYHDCYAEMNEHGLFMQRHGKREALSPHQSSTQETK
jgi:hypothetical protein